MGETEVGVKDEPVAFLPAIARRVKVSEETGRVLSLCFSTKQAISKWVERYGHRIEESRLPKSEEDRLALAQQIGAYGRKVLTAVFDSLSPSWLREIPAIEILRRIWVQNSFVEDKQLRWREGENLPPAARC